MIFGRKKRKAAEQDGELEAEEQTLDKFDDDVDVDADDDAEAGEDLEETAEAEDDIDEDDSDDDESDDADSEGEEPAEELDEWAALDASRDWRENGPFDIDEVDLDADDVERLDFGCVVLTPFKGMQMQLQVDQRTKKVQAALVMAGASAIEVALFAAPAHTSMVAEIRDEMIASTQKAGGKASLAEGPFGTEVRRIIPMQDPKGNKVVHISRTWFAEGPRWMLRGVVMGEAGRATGIDGTSELVYEFFSNTVVRRDDQPRVPGDLIPMTLPKSVATTDAAEAEKTEAKG